MPESKMARKKRRNDEDEASEALLDELMQRGNAREEQDEKNDDPFMDDEGDARVVPTMADLSSLVTDEASINALPMREILRRNLQVTLRAIEMAEIAYHANPRQGTATALTQMQNMCRDLVKAIEERQDPKNLADEIDAAVIRPLIAEYIKILTSEAERKRASLLVIVPPESSGIVVHEMNDLLAGMTDGMDAAYVIAQKQLEELLCSKLKKAK